MPRTKLTTFLGVAVVAPLLPLAFVGVPPSEGAVHADTAARRAGPVCHGGTTYRKKSTFRDAVTVTARSRRRNRRYTINASQVATYDQCNNGAGATLLRARSSRFCQTPVTVPSNYQGASMNTHYFEPGHRSVNPPRTRWTARCISQVVALSNTVWFYASRLPGYNNRVQFHLRNGPDFIGVMRTPAGHMTRRFTPRRDRVVG